MTTPSERGGGRTGQRGRGRGRAGRGDSQNYGYQRTMMPPPAPRSIPTIGDYSTYLQRQKQAFRKEDIIPSKKNEGGASSSKEQGESSSSKQKEAMSYKDVATNEATEAGETLKKASESVLYIEEEDMKNDPWAVQKRYLDSRGYPGLQGKSRPLLEQLLVLTESVIIKHNYQDLDPNKQINYSKCHIVRLLAERDWGINPNTPKSIEDKDGQLSWFNYWDYIEAFTLMFYYQNPKAKHSWFFSIDPKVITRVVPNWFYRWWATFGPIISILPKEIASLYDPWIEKSPLAQKINPSKIIEGQSQMLFFVKFQIPWIWKWQFETGYDELSIPILKRSFFLKWWKGIDQKDLSKLIQSIKDDISENAVQKPATVNNHQNMGDTYNLYKRLFPDYTEAMIMVKVLDHQKNQFLNLFEDGGDTTMKSVSSNNSLDEMQIAGESQMEPSISDVWDSMIEMLRQQKEKSKGT